MPRKSKNAPPPEWLAPLQEWVREIWFALMSNRHFDDAEALRLLMRDRGDEIARLMRGFRSGDVPAALPSADASRAPFKRPPLDRVLLLLPALRVELKQQAILDDLPDDKRREICAAGEVIWTAYHAHKHGARLERGRPHDLQSPRRRRRNQAGDNPRRGQGARLSRRREDPRRDEGALWLSALQADAERGEVLHWRGSALPAAARALEEARLRAAFFRRTRLSPPDSIWSGHGTAQSAKADWERVPMTAADQVDALTPALVTNRRPPPISAKPNTSFICIAGAVRVRRLFYTAHKSDTRSTNLSRGRKIYRASPPAPKPTPQIRRAPAPPPGSGLRPLARGRRDGTSIRMAQPRTFERKEPHPREARLKPKR